MNVTFIVMLSCETVTSVTPRHTPLKFVSITNLIGLDMEWSLKNRLSCKTLYCAVLSRKIPQFKLCGKTDYPPEDVMWPPWAGQLCGCLGPWCQCPVTWDGQQSADADHSHYMVSQDQVRPGVNLEFWQPMNLYIFNQIIHPCKYEVYKICLFIRLQAPNQLLTFYWLKLKWNKMENLYPVPSESWLGEGSQEKQNENSPHFVVCMKMFLWSFKMK